MVSTCEEISCSRQDDRAEKLWQFGRGAVGSVRASSVARHWSCITGIVPDDAHAAATCPERICPVSARRHLARQPVQES